ncbi:hypothetical protein D3C76_1084810 [compost metagenome]
MPSSFSDTLGPIARILAATAQQMNNAPAHRKNLPPVARRPSANELFSAAASAAGAPLRGTTTASTGHFNITPSAATAATAMMIMNGSEVVWNPVCSATPLKIGPKARPVVNDSVAISAAFLPPSFGPKRTSAMLAAPVKAPVPIPASRRAINIIKNESAIENSKAPANTTSSAGTIMLRRSLTLPAMLPTPNSEISTPAA